MFALIHQRQGPSSIPHPPDFIAHPLSERKLAAPSRKKQRLNEPPKETSRYKQSNKSWLCLLPFELLQEIFSYLTTQNILNLSHTGKYLCTTLYNKEAKKIWMVARNNYEYYCVVPDPPPGLSEPAYASILFDGGKCEVCGRHTPNPPRYFEERMWLCDSEKCEPRICKKFMVIPAPSPKEREDREDRENRLILAAIRMRHFMFSGSSCLMMSQRVWSEAKKEFQAKELRTPARDELFKMWKQKATMLQENSLFDSRYERWRAYCVAYRKKLLRDIEKLLEGYGKRHHWDKQDLQNSPFLQQLRHHSIIEYSPLDRHTLDAHYFRIDQEIKALQIYRVNRSEEHEHAARREAVAQLWLQGTSSRRYKTLWPTLNTFRNLPSIRHFEHGISSAADFIDNDRYVKLAHKDLDAFHSKTRKILSKRLKSPSILSSETLPPLIHPCDQVTTFFECIRCLRVGRKSSQQGGLDYVWMIKHRCPKDVRGIKSREWDISNFQVDEVAQSVAKKAMRVAGLDEAQATRETIDSMGARWKCLQCPSKLTLLFRNIPGHTKLHSTLGHLSSHGPNDSNSGEAAGVPVVTGRTIQSIDVEFVSEEEFFSAPNIPHPFPNTEWLVGKDADSARARASKTFGCRHCAISKTGGKDKMFTFHGLFSHLLSCHYSSVGNSSKESQARAKYFVRDEDYYSIEPHARPLLEASDVPLDEGAL